MKFCQTSIQKISQRERPDATDIKVAEDLLARMETEVKTRREFELTTSPYNRLLRAYARSLDEQSIYKATALLKHMQSSDYLPYPDTFTYDAALFVCTTSTHQKAGETAESILQEMQAVSESYNGAYTVSPTLTSYHNVIYSHANQSKSIYGAAAAAEDWLMRLSDLSCQPGNQHLQPTNAAFNRVLQAWSVSAENKGADRALQILELMMKLNDSETAPDAISFGTVIDAFARRDRPHEAELVLKKALDYFVCKLDEEGGERSDGAVIDLTSNGLNRSMSAWSKSSQVDAAYRSKDLLDDAYTLSSRPRRHHRLKFAPDANSHYFYMLTLLKSENGLEVADEHVYSMIQECLIDPTRPLPTTGIFNTVMTAWAQSKHPDRAERVSRLLQQMILLSEAVDLTECKPVRGTFSICADVWYKSGLPNAAQELLSVLEMSERRQSTEAFIYQACINALCSEGTPQATVKALEVLRRYEQRADERIVEWDPRQACGLYTRVIQELGKVRHHKAADLALSLFRGMATEEPREAKPTSRTYTAMMVCFSRLRSPSATQMVLDLYHEMKERDAITTSKVRLDGIVFKIVLSALVNAQDVDKAVDVVSFLLQSILDGRSDLATGGILVYCNNLLPRIRCSDELRKELGRKMDIILANSAASMDGELHAKSRINSV